MTAKEAVVHKGLCCQDVYSNYDMTLAFPALDCVEEVHHGKFKPLVAR